MAVGNALPDFACFKLDCHVGSIDVKEADRKRMLGHSLKGDITNGVYGHRSVEELKKEIEKIEKVC